MKVTVMKKATVSSLPYGERLQLDVEHLDNVSSIEETTENDAKYYSITHQNSGEATPHVTAYPVNEYMISIM